MPEGGLSKAETSNICIGNLISYNKTYVELG